jgi:LacI family transcriptional regulator
MAVRLKDIAKDVGVSVVTVSKVLRNHSDIGDDTRRRVLQRMKELNYRPNLAARALVTGRSFTMGLVVPGLVHSFFGEIAKGVASGIRASGYSLLISSSLEDPELERHEVEQLVARQVDILMLTSAETDERKMAYLAGLSVPLIMIDRRFASLPAHFIGIDDEAAGFIGTQHLIERGCKRIAHLSGPDRNTVRGRVTGYRRALERHGMKVPPGGVVRAHAVDDEGEHAGYGAMRELLKRDPRPDGVFCHNDPTALGAIRAIEKSGLRVPQDIAVAGCGNLHYNDLLRVPLTSVDQQTAKIGEAAARLALKLVDAKPRPEPEAILLEPSLIVRSSTARL